MNYLSGWLFAVIVALSTIVAAMGYDRNTRLGIYDREIQLQNETILRLQNDINTLVHYPESQQAESIIYRVRLFALVDSTLENY